MRDYSWSDCVGMGLLCVIYVAWPRWACRSMR